MTSALETHILHGIPAAVGVVMAPVFMVVREGLQIPTRPVAASAVKAEQDRFRRAVTRARTDILRVRTITAKNTGEAQARIFDAQILLLEDPALLDGTLSGIHTAHHNAEAVFHALITEMSASFAMMNDAYMAERVDDLRDVANRVLHHLLGVQLPNLSSIDRQVILCTPQIAPSEAAQLPRQFVMGLCTERGGATSHAAIMARDMEIPAVVGMGDAFRLITMDSEGILDGEQGTLILNPDAMLRAKYSKRLQTLQRARRRLQALRDLPAITLDGHEVCLAANIELTAELDSVTRHGAQGIGLYRTELLYMNGPEPPTEEQQYEAYKLVAAHVAPHTATIRTFDLGGDKFSLSMDSDVEMNPFLGKRAIRIGLERPDLFKVQLRAMLRASAAGNVRIMFPMVTTLDEVMALKALLKATAAELRSEGNACPEELPPIGIMIEVPAAALTARRLAKEVAFFSIGTNDLVQYTLAVDRGLPDLNYLYQPYHPAVIELIARTCDAAIEADIDVGLCGEMAGDPLATPLLLGLGVQSFSMSPVCVPQVKQVVRSLSLGDAREVAAQCRRCHRQSEVLSILQQAQAQFLKR